MHKGRSGLIFSKNDGYIRDLVIDPLYDVRPDGTIWTRVAKTGKVFVDPNKWRRAGFVKDGYWRLSYKRKKLSQHRIIFQKFKGELEVDLVISHKDNDGLNNHPENVILDTQSGNNFNAYKDQNRAPCKGNKKITQEIADEIRKLQREGWTNKQLREQFEMSKSSISYIVNNKTWIKT